MSILWLATALAAAPGVELGPIEIRRDTIEIGVTGLNGRPPKLMNGTIVFEFPGAEVEQIQHVLGDGPVAELRLTPRPSGGALVLVPRGPVEDVLSRVKAGESSIVIGPKPEAPAIVAPAIIAPPKAPVADAAAPVNFLEQKRSAEARPAVGVSYGSAILPWVMGVALIGLLAFVFARKASSRKVQDGIDIISDRALGHHRLLVVDVRGERMLLAASDKQMVLLTRLRDASASMDSAEFARILEERSLQGEPVIERELPRGPARSTSTSVSPTQPRRVVSEIEKPEGSQDPVDITGLLRLREKRGPRVWGAIA